ncbi:hypothetical protein IKG06_00020 [Candidatus Saccharibacteria bacterium]|nr:hypothetical protein [Candidatus Saccharibacteria bacterium]
MRKSTKLMAGLGVVAGLGVALAPLSTFADTAGSDTLRLTITSSCNIATNGETPASPIVFNGLYVGPDTAASASPTEVTLAAQTPETGTAVDTINFTCTENSKVSLSAATTGLAGPGTTITTVKGAYSGTGVAFETAFAGGAYGLIRSDTLIGVGTATSANSNGISFTRTGYKVTPNANQAPGTYEGTVDYEWALASND